MPQSETGVFSEEKMKRSKKTTFFLKAYLFRNESSEKISVYESVGSE